MYAIGLAMTLRPGCYAEYKKAHDELWADIAKSMSDNQVNMAIYRFGENLIIHATAPSEEHWDRSRQAPILVEWHDYMAKLLETDAAGEILFEELEEAFAFGQFKG